MAKHAMTYIPSDEAMKFIAFIRACNIEDNANAEIHYKLADKFFGKSKQIVIESFRGSAKSTIMLWFLIYAAVNGRVHNFGEVEFIAFVGDSAENGVKNFFRNMVSKIDKSKLLSSLLTVKRKTDSEMELVNSGGHQVNFKGFGMKALSLDTKLFIPEGFTSIGECRLGDSIYGADGKLCKITHKSEVFNKPMYRLVLKDGRSLKVSDDHINSVVRKEGFNNKAVYTEYDMTTKELLECDLTHSRERTRKGKPNYTSTEHLFFIKNVKAIEYETKEFTLDPYTLGVLLGDGAMNGKQSVRVCGMLSDLKVYESKIPYKFGKYNHDTRTEDVYSVGILGLQQIVKALGINTHGNVKRIPEEYFYGDIEQRLKVLQGLMDTDGTISTNGRTIFVSNSETLVRGVIRLVRSLGGKATINRNREAYSTEMWLNAPLFQLERKSVRQRFDRDEKVAITAIEEIPAEYSQCIAVDNKEHQFIVDDYIRTHNTNIRGVTYFGTRPDMVVLDDVTTNEAMTSKIIQDTINDNFYKAILPALHPTKYRIYVIGTPISEKDILHQLMNNKEWAVHKFPICEKFPCDRKEFKGNWEDRFPYDAVMSKYRTFEASRKLQDFYQEYMLELTDLSTLLVEDEDIKWYDPSIVYKDKESYNFYISTDFAVSQQETADYTTIGVWAVNSDEGWMLVDGICKRQSMDKTMEDLFKFVKIYNPLGVGIENTGQQLGSLDLIVREGIKRKVYINLAKKIGGSNKSSKGIRPTKDKLSRFIQGVVPRFKSGKIYLPRGEDLIGTNRDLYDLVEEMKNELSKLTMAAGVKALKHDDTIDLLNMMSEMEIAYPSVYIDYKLDKSSNSWIYDDDYEEDETYVSSCIF